MTAPAAHVVLPAGVDDPTRPSGGNVYDRRVCDALVRAGRALVEHQVAGEWPVPDRAALEALGRVLAACPDDSRVLVDGLVACGAPAVLLAHRDRLRVVVLVHLPLGVQRPAARAGEQAVLRSCAAVVPTSGWTRRWLLAHYRLDPSRVLVVRPGVDPAPRRAAAPVSAAGTAMLVAGPVRHAKGHDVLVDALARIELLPWSCTWAGSTEVDPAFVARTRRRLAASGIAERVEMRGAVPPGEMPAVYAASDLLVVPSRLETYGMVVTEALAHGVPVVACDVGGVREALACTPDGSRPGLLVARDDAAALASALRDWLTTPALRARLRHTVGARQPHLEPWDSVAGRLGAVLDAVAAGSRADVSAV